MRPLRSPVPLVAERPLPMRDLDPTNSIPLAPARVHHLSIRIANKLTFYFSLRSGQIESNYDETVDSFDEMNLKAELLRGKSHLLPRAKVAGKL